MKRIKVFFIITGLNQGGAEAMLFKLLANINREKFECAVISLGDMGVHGENIVSLGFPVFTLGMRPRQFSLFKIFFYLKIVRNFKPDFIQGWMYHANLFAILAKIISPSAKVFFNIRCSLNHSLKWYSKSWAVVKLNAFFSHFVAKVINNSQVSSDQHKTIGFSKKNGVLIANGFEINGFKPNSEIYKNFRLDHHLDLNTKIVGNVSRYHPMKNHLGILFTFHKIKAQYPDKLILVLGGREIDSNNDKLAAAIKDLGLQEDCILMGSVKSCQIMPAFDVYLSSSSYGEGFPNVLGEAMLCGVPCVATDVGDCKQLMGGLGAVAAPGDYDLLAKHCLEKLDISNEERVRIRQHVIDHYSIEKIVDQYQNLYAEILNREN